MKYRYSYSGDTTVHLPLHGVTAQGGDGDAVYETDMPISHPDFTEVKAKGEQTKKTTK